MIARMQLICFFDEGKALYNLARDRFKALDGKAATLIGIVTTGFGAIAVAAAMRESTRAHTLESCGRIASLQLRTLA